MKSLRLPIAILYGALMASATLVATHPQRNLIAGMVAAHSAATRLEARLLATPVLPSLVPRFAPGRFRSQFLAAQFLAQRPVTILPAVAALETSHACQQAELARMRSELRVQARARLALQAVAIRLQAESSRLTAQAARERAQRVVAGY